MARARNIKPKFFQNDELGELPPLARLLFIGLWTIADFKGCLEYRWKRIKTQILPYDECDVEELVSDLDKSGFISTYSVAGRLYIKILKFEEHQNPHKNERDGGSDLPDISEKDKEINALNDDGKNRKLDGSDRADSLNLIPEPLNLIPLSQKIPHTPQAGLERKSSNAISLKAYLEKCKAANAKPIPEDDSVFDYAAKCGVPTDFLRLQWLEFKDRYGMDGAKRYKSWPSVFGKSVRGNWFKLWYIDNNEKYSLTTVGQQAKRQHGESI